MKADKFHHCDALDCPVMSRKSSELTPKNYSSILSNQHTRRYIINNGTTKARACSPLCLQKLAAGAVQHAEDAARLADARVKDGERVSTDK